VILGVKMKNLIFVVLLVVVAIAGYTIINKPNENVENMATSVAPSAEKTSQVNNEATVANTDVQEANPITPADLSEAAQKEMYAKIFDYQKCMLKQRLEYAKEHVKMTDMVNKTISACEPRLDELATVLADNHVNEGLRKKMVHTMRSKAARKLMSNMMKSMATQAAAASGVSVGPVPVPAAPAPVTNP